jgi:hypothetical protein
MGTNADGSPKVVQHRISLAQQLAEHSAAVGGSQNGISSTQEALHDLEENNSPYCSGLLTMWDRSNWTGNEICFATYEDRNHDEFGYTWLGKWCLDSQCSASWWSKTRSYYVPNLPYPPYDGLGYFQDYSEGGTPPHQEYFTCFESWNSDCGSYKVAGWVAQNSEYVFLGHRFTNE